MTGRFSAQISEGEYNALDLAATQGIFDKMVAEGGIDASAFDHAMLGPGLTMGLRGIRVDERKRENILKATLADAKDWWVKLEPHGFTQGKALAPSPYQLQKVLYGTLKALYSLIETETQAATETPLPRSLKAPGLVMGLSRWLRSHLNSDDWRKIEKSLPNTLATMEECTPGSELQLQLLAGGAVLVTRSTKALTFTHYRVAFGKYLSRIVATYLFPLT